MLFLLGGFAMKETILQVNNLCKRYKHHQVLDSVNMSIQKGDIYGFVGKNGAGKTTLIRIISGLIHAEEGNFSLLGIDSSDKRRFCKEKGLHDGGISCNIPRFNSPR